MRCLAGLYRFVPPLRKACLAQYGRRIPCPGNPRILLWADTDVVTNNEIIHETSERNPQTRKHALPHPNKRCAPGTRDLASHQFCITTVYPPQSQPATSHPCVARQTCSPVSGVTGVCLHDRPFFVKALHHRLCLRLPYVCPSQLTRVVRAELLNHCVWRANAPCDIIVPHIIHTACIRRSVVSRYRLHFYPALRVHNIAITYSHSFLFPRIACVSYHITWCMNRSVAMFVPL